MGRNISDLINIYERMKADGINDVDGEEFDTACEEAIKVFRLIEAFVDGNESALSCGGEWMYQSDSGQIQGLDFAASVLDCLEDYAENVE